jgi:hypothetical protein
MSPKPVGKPVTKKASPGKKAAPVKKKAAPAKKASPAKRPGKLPDTGKKETRAY